MNTSQQCPDVSYSETRSKSGVLTPGSDISQPGTNARKRKREFPNSIQDLLKDSFTVRPQRSLVFAKPRTLQPILLLPRTELKLSYLDNGASSCPLSQSRFFESHIKILELEARLGSRPMVLIARLDDGKSTYAVEREDRGLYVLCRLGSWVNLETLKDTAAVSRTDHSIEISSISGGVTQGSSEVGLASLITPESSKYNKKQKLAIEAIQTMVKRPPPQVPIVEAPHKITPVVPTSTATTPSLVQDSTAGLAEQRKDEPIPTSETVEPTAAELLDTIRAQYLEALYLSKASLAYFPKGPLSRARAAFHLDFDSTLNMKDLTEFLESLVLTTSTMDKKFRDSLPELVKTMAGEFLSGDETSKPTKKRKSKKMKPGKNGLYPGEDELIRKWLNSNRDNDSGILNESIIKSRISELRIRETQLQMVVLLEILALKSLTNVVAGDGELPPTGPTRTLELKKEKLSKSKKQEGPEALIDVHIDRLCIWQEVANENGAGCHNTSFDSEISSGGLASIGKHETNALRDFCIEVVGPFFSARLPDLCATINHKLGGPMAKPPPRQKLAKSASASGSVSRPGAATRRPVPDKSRQSLQRVLTDERRARSVSRGTPDSAAISLMRSVSMSTIPRLKRETSEAISLASIPSIESQSSRSDVLNKKRYSQREVDMSVPPSAVADLKNKKQAAVEAELQEAIVALKKPNRQLAGRVLAETAEQRAASASKSTRKTTKPIRNPLFQGAQGVQIMATPKNSRHKDMMAGPRSVLNNATPQKSSQEVIPASSAGQVPDSTIRPRSATLANTSFAAPHAHPSTERKLFNVAETPSRPPSRSRTWLNNSQPPDFPPSSPDFTRTLNSHKEEFQFAVPNSVIKNPFASANDNSTRLDVVQATPTKSRNGSMRSLSSFAPPSLPSFSQRRESSPSASIGNASKSSDIVITKEKENLAPFPVQQTEENEDIYKALGWDNDDLDDLA